MEGIVRTIDSREEEQNKISDKIEGSEELRAEELAAETSLDIQDDSKETSPLLRLPDEIRNKIYGYLAFDCDVRIQYEPKGDLALVSFDVDFVCSEEDLKSVDIFWIYSEEHLTLFQTNRQIRQEAHVYILDHCSSWVNHRDLIRYGITSEADEYFRNLVIDDSETQSCRNRDNLRKVGDCLGTLCTEGKLDLIVVFDSVDVDTPKWTLKQYVYPGRFTIAEYLRVMLHSDMVGREISVETDRAWTGIPKWHCGSDSDSDSDPDSDCESDSEYYYGDDRFWNWFSRDN